jgi:hypothetical protein
MLSSNVGNQFESGSTLLSQPDGDGTPQELDCMTQVRLPVLGPCCATFLQGISHQCGEPGTEGAAFQSRSQQSEIDTCVPSLHVNTIKITPGSPSNRVEKLITDEVSVL